VCVCIVVGTAAAMEALLLLWCSVVSHALAFSQVVFAQIFGRPIFMYESRW
jgi:hypothetical protein